MKMPAKLLPHAFISSSSERDIASNRRKGLAIQTFILMLTLLPTQTYCQTSGTDVLQLIADHVNAENIWQMQEDYEAGYKWVAYFHFETPIVNAGVSLSIDLPDYLGITPEGEEGWVSGVYSELVE